jgi:hypothetical protein
LMAYNDTVIFPPKECAFLYPIGDENASLLPMSVILTGNRF